MKKGIGTFFLLCTLLLFLPYGPRAAAAEDSYIIDMHGTRTYLGTSTDWAKTWDTENFKDVTSQNVDCDGDLTLKAGTVKNITAGSGAVKIVGGSVANTSSYGPITISGGNIRGNVVSDGDSISLSGTLNIHGSLNAGQSVTFASGVIAASGSVTGKISCSTRMSTSRSAVP